MQVLDEKKRRRIRQVAAALFAERPYEAVRLEEVARLAGVGKGTLYTYYAGKDELYLAVIFDGFNTLVETLRRQLVDCACSAVPAEPPDPRRQLAAIVDALLAFADRHPKLFQLTRTSPPLITSPAWVQRRQELEGIIQQVIRAGNRARIWHDPHPEWTAQYIPGMVRAVFLYQPRRPKREALARHLKQILIQGLGAAESSPGRTGSPQRAHHRE